MKTAEIIKAMEAATQGVDVFQSQHLNARYQTPNRAFIKQHPFIKSGGKGIDYLPVDKVEFLLDYFFNGKWKCEVLATEMAADRIQVTVRLHYLHPENQEWLFHDGCAVKIVQQESDKEEKDLLYSLKQIAYSQPNPIDKAKYLTSYYNLQTAKPVRREAWEAVAQIAKSEALKDAADHLGPIFGRDLNRKDSIEVLGTTATPAPAPYQAAPQPQNTLIDL